MTELLRHFEDFVLAQGGKIIDHSRDKKDRFICTIFPVESALQRGDMLAGGLAARVEDESLQLHAYFLRQVCTNGMIRASEVQSETFSAGQLYEFQTYLPACVEQLYQADLPKTVEQFRFSLFQEVSESRLRQIAYQVAHLTGNQNSTRQFSLRVREEAARPQSNPRFKRGRNPRLFDVINGVTALARDTADPTVRWNLMRLGGDLLADATQSGPYGKAEHQEEEATQLLHMAGRV